MAGLTQTVHIATDFDWRKAKEVAPVLVKSMGITTTDGSEPMALTVTDIDGECHTYIFGDDGKKTLIARLTGGLVVPSGAPH